MAAGLITLAWACGGGEDPLAGTSWSLRSLGPASSPGPSLSGVDVTAAFAEDGSMSGRGGCNHYDGPYRAGEDGSFFADVVWTSMACLEIEGLMDQERRFFRLLTGAESFEVEDDRLTLRTSGGDALVFLRSSSP